MNEHEWRFGIWATTVMGSMAACIWAEWPRVALVALLIIELAWGCVEYTRR